MKQRLSNIHYSNIIYTLLRTVIAVLFFIAGVIKIQDLSAFAEVIAAFGLVPDPLPGIFAIALPLIEITVGILLLLDFKGSLGVVTIMTVMFFAVLTYAIYMGFDIDCGCYGPGDPEAEAFQNIRGALWRDFGILAGVGYLYWFRYTNGIRLKRLFVPVGILKNRDKENLKW